MMNTATTLPDFLLDPGGELGNRFVAKGLKDYRAAARYVWSLPYGRNTDRSDYRLVLDEGRGTCSTKHALLADLAREHAQPVELMLGIYEMSGDTPGVGAVLRRHGLSRIPEAHCYLVFEGRRVDLTRQREAEEPAELFLHEERIEPRGIGEYKVERHREFLRWWTIERGLDFERVWRTREECIAALAEPRGAAGP